MPDENGISLREHLEEVERQTGHTPKELQGPSFPDLLGHVWFAFLSLSPNRGQGMSGVLPLTYQEIDSWMKVTGNCLAPHEVTILKRLDNVYRRVMNV